MQNQTLPKSQRNMIVAVMIVSAFVAILNQTLLNTALPHIMKGLHITENTSQWLVTGFMLVNGVMIPLTAFLMDKIKTRPLFLMAMGIFLIGSIVAALAPTFPILMLARVIQAIGAGVIMPLMQFTLFMLFPKDERGFAMGLAGLVIQFAPAIGPTLSGLIVDTMSWRMPFVVVVIVASLGFIFGAIFLKSYNETKDTKLDKRSVIYSTLGFGLMLYAFSSAGNLGFHNPIVLVSLAISLVIIGAFIRRQIRISNPLLNIIVFKNKVFCLTTISSMIVMLSMVGPALLIPLYVQNALGLSALLSGLVIMPGAIINGVMSIFTGKFYDKYGARPLVLTGFTLLTIFTVMLCFLKADTSYTYLIIVYALRMFSVSLLMMPLNTAGINSLSNKNISHGTAISNFGRVTAGSLGTALMVTIMSIGSKNFAPDPSANESQAMIQRQAIAAGVDLSFAVVSVLVFIGLIIACFIKENRAETKVNTREV
ncbi:multidrug efflux MFS transporter [Staphylococcus gallinarum]|jgi:DHA2 family multidrug resistance protein-like MFS transporter|uniref:DHA2 family efflux MFS transporter permease subunit n=1 Tax=Staphylococcus gallinarum TaxID=1293 RepID=A0A2T4T1R9_STAGA|nr:MDR family MFS transporter [Staphylococcus gallinarum]MCD8821639.1 multidrug efflux MFS transporter [Staphylococcus gallinarum]MCD8827147.1 multidrug efflux MFS transporter [Staphylococcus gallinarum]MCQ9289477.1 multidrug efflux MFS transporter [Staphylococcus gallinarum]PTE78871.1 MFS transporter [Staphylococcus gallinarum]PTL05981.1 MFS transporter [Staphylococcus gallinarum]